ncbi:MAG: enoyl-CoA hydratase-related protein [Bacillota bacterium]
MSGILLDIQGRISTITLNNPDKLNPLSPGVRREIMEALRECSAQKVHVTVIKGAGRAFSSGYAIDVKNTDDSYLPAQDIMEDRITLWELYADFLQVLRRHPTPVLAQIHGYCLSGGTDIMLSSDIAIAAEDAKIGMPNTRGLGISIDLLLWPMHIGPMRSKLMAFTGDHISGKQAEEWGLVAKAVPAEKLEAYVQALAERISLVDRDALMISKMAINESVNVMGYHQLIESAANIDTIAHFTGSAQRFNRIANEVGLKAALDQRDKLLRGKTFSDL